MAVVLEMATVEVRVVEAMAVEVRAVGGWEAQTEEGKAAEAKAEEGKVEGVLEAMAVAMEVYWEEKEARSCNKSPPMMTLMVQVQNL